jgi:hypothetical protein
MAGDTWWPVIPRISNLTSILDKAAAPFFYENMDQLFSEPDMQMIKEISQTVGQGGRSSARARRV